MDKEWTPMIVLGGGGHTQEMVEIVKKGPVFASMNIVCSSCDSLSAKIFKSEAAPSKYSLYTIERPNDVHEKYSMHKMLYSLFLSILLVLRTNSHFLLCNGPGLCVPLVIAYKLVYPFRPVFYIESTTRITSLSTTGAIVQYIASRFIVQSKHLERKSYPRRTYHKIFDINTMK
ncbi:beta-1,4-N-acetylglucosaminyltransferase [Nematocida minor]|uniref:beta-1,4-N-acetylglucosaminyltransferase n=1 Tax=Nematocida minor TaxID=1912983 RepID=UPI00221E79E4|nr:beta-1,4-N-acetylglucosaminyltransferase [Nematocida minor]KAI5192648.1 beta-1,4-N-acetylglucosaminyltransferase [Nematocida minor]